MQCTRSTRGSVLGKRPHQSDIPMPASPRSIQVPTPDPTPKRPRTTICFTSEDDGNKENVPPLRLEALLDSPTANRRARRRTSAPESPTRSRISTRRHTSTSDVPQTAETPTGSRVISTPLTPPPTPPISLSSRARALLRPTTNGLSQIAGRDKERDVITKFAESFTNDDTPTTLYISGPPGSGKTALVNDVMAAMKKSDFKYITLNCMTFNGIDALWQRLLEELDDNKKPRAKPASLKKEIERVLKTLKMKCMLVLDELDHIADSASSLLSLLSLPKSVSKILRVIGIANTHTLTSTSSSDCADVSSIKTLHFSPYTSAQLLTILQSRLAPILEDEQKEEAAKFLPRHTLTLLATKVAITTGDVRALFGVLRGAIDKAVAASIPADLTSESPKTPSPAITPPHVLAALKAYSPAAATVKSGSTVSSSEIVTKVKDLGLQARLVVLVILLASRRLESGLPLGPVATSSPSKSPTKRSAGSNVGSSTSVQVSQLHGFYTSALARAENDVFSPVGRSEFGDLLAMLETIGLITLSNSTLLASPVKGGKRTLSRSASFGPSKSQGQGQEVKLAADIRTDEILRGLGVVGDAEASNIKEEVKAFWETEVARLRREMKGKEDKEKSPVKPDVLGDAKKD